MEIKTLLAKEIQKEVENLNRYEAGSDEHKAAVESITKLTDRYSKLYEIDKTSDDRFDERDLKVAEIENDRKNRKWDKILNVGMFAVNVGLGIWVVARTWLFDKASTTTSTKGKKVINSFFPFTRH